MQPAAPPTAASASFAGSAACAECHAAEHAAWTGSHHELAMLHADADSVLGDFDDARFEYFGETTRFFRDGDDFRVETAGADGELAQFTVAYTFGVEPLQQYLVPLPAGRLQVLPFAWDTRPAAAGGQRWFHLYPDEHIAPGDILHWTTRQQNWNYMCAECHSTNLVMGYDAAADRYATTFSEVSVGCEACHGPGSQHISEARAGKFANSLYGLPVDLDDQGRAVWRMNAETGIAARSEPAMRPPQQPESCGRCHSRRGVLTDEYEYGRPLTDSHMPALLEDGLYFADGQINDEVYVYGSFLQSRMYRAGVTCSNCHDPHSLELKTGPEPDAVCAQCHLPAVFAAAGHTGHTAGDVACVDCHMPERTYMVVDPRRDHGFRVPRPDLSAELGTPDVCANCHADRTAGWAAASLAALHGKPDRPEFATALDAARRGDANEKLLAILAEGSTPGIARATALELFAPPLGEPEVRALAAGLEDPDPLVRLAAVRLARLAPPEFRLQYGTARLDDDVRAVRLEAAMTFADMRDMLPPVARTAFAGAEDEFVHSQSIQLDRPEAWVSLGDLAAAKGEIDAALARYERAMAMQPLLVRARVNMADALRRQGDDARGREILEAGIALVPDAAALHHALGLLLVRQRELAAALAALETAVELEPGNPRYRYVLDVARSEIGQPVPD
ncbi:MAG TPA: multiheme c-type cytochrome [Woeseiaceae bacterium]|nr:multiheme c-type cytochrome [Woeseiaceae bacterium]